MSVNAGTKPKSSLEGVAEFRLLATADLLVERDVGPQSQADQSQNDNQSVEIQKKMLVFIISDIVNQLI